MKRARQKLGHKPRCTASKRTRLSTADVRPQRSALDGHDAMLAHVLSLKPPSLPSLFRIRATARAPGRHLTPSLSRNTFSQPAALKVSSWMARSRAPVLTRASTVDRTRLTSEIRSEGLQLGPWRPRGHGRGGGALAAAPAPAEALGRGHVAFSRRAAREPQLLELVVLGLIVRTRSS